jgi:hypothetical protein
VVVLTCKQHKHLSDALLAGIAKYWPEVTPLVMVDTDRSTEADLPPDVRDVVRRVPYLRRVFDAPPLITTEKVYVLDADCLLYRHPTDWKVPMYQSSPCFWDDPAGVNIWRELGVEFETVAPRLVGGVFSAYRSMWTANYDLAIEYVRICAGYGLDRMRYPGVTCEQGLVAGLWRKTYADQEDAILDPSRYPIGDPTDDMTLWHLGPHKGSPRLPKMLQDYWDSL